MKEIKLIFFAPTLAASLSALPLGSHSSSPQLTASATTHPTDTRSGKLSFENGPYRGYRANTLTGWTIRTLCKPTYQPIRRFRSNLFAPRQPRTRR
jgi:hypothetical protein